jgi:hypothetical protein
MFSYSTGYYVSPPVDQYLKFKNRCSLMYIYHIFVSAFLHICQSASLHASTYVSQSICKPVSLSIYSYSIYVLAYVYLCRSAVSAPLHVLSLNMSVYLYFVYLCFSAFHLQICTSIVFLFLHICTSVYLQVYMRVPLYLSLFVSLYLCLSTPSYSIYVLAYVYLCRSAVSARLHVHTSVYFLVCIFVPLFICMSTYLYLFQSVHLHMRNSVCL